MVLELLEYLSSPLNHGEGLLEVPIRVQKPAALCLTRGGRECALSGTEAHKAFDRLRALQSSESRPA